MNLSFKEYFPNGNPTFFIAKIISSALEHSHEGLTVKSYHTRYKAKFGKDWHTPRDLYIAPKRHAIRSDEKDCWEKGENIHFIVNNRSKNRFQFAPVLPVKHVEKISIKWSSSDVRVVIGGNLFYERINGISNDQQANRMQLLAQYEGFDSVEEFFAWFNKSHEGKIIHWTDWKWAKGEVYAIKFFNDGNSKWLGNFNGFGKLPLIKKDGAELFYNECDAKAFRDRITAMYCEQHEKKNIDYLSVIEPW